MLVVLDEAHRCDVYKTSNGYTPTNAEDAWSAFTSKVLLTARNMHDSLLELLRSR
jgi:hypothetical protein